MANLFYDMLLFGVCLELASFFLWAFNILGAIGIVYPMGSVTSMTSVQGIFNITPLTAIIGTAGVITTIVALLLRAGSYPIFAVLIFTVGVFINFVSGFFLAIPNTIAALIPASANPTPNTLNPISVVIGVIFVFALFFYVFEMLLQRKVS